MTQPTPSRPVDASGPWQDANRGAGLIDASGRSRPNIFAEMSAIAVATGAVNLGQGFPDYSGPQEVLDAAASAVLAGRNQYPPGRGVPELRTAIADHHRRFYGIDLDPDTQVCATAGATEALAAVILGLVRPGDEVVVIEPFYDAYAADIARADGVQVNVPLTWSPASGSGRTGFVLDSEALRSAIRPSTRMIVVNTPHNPTGAILDDADLALIARLARENDAIILSDEVYEHLTFGRPHRPVATFEGAAERTLTLGSGGKTFSVTGWKIGWATGPAPLVEAAFGMKQWLSYVNGAPLQPAIAVGLGLDDDVYLRIASDLGHRRDLLCSALSEVGFEVAIPEAGYFVIADAAPFGVTDADAFCRELPHRCGVVAIPVTSFCRPEREDVRSLVRFAYCKCDATLDEAVRRLRSLKR